MNKAVTINNILAYILLVASLITAIWILLCAKDFTPSRAGIAFNICSNAIAFATGQINAAVSVNRNDPDCH